MYASQMLKCGSIRATILTEGCLDYFFLFAAFLHDSHVYGMFMECTILYILHIVKGKERNLEFVVQCLGSSSW